MNLAVGVIFLLLNSLVLDTFATPLFAAVAPFEFSVGPRDLFSLSESKETIEQPLKRHSFERRVSHKADGNPFDAFLAISNCPLSNGFSSLIPRALVVLAVFATDQVLGQSTSSMRL
jgi:hypothetical protein